MLHSWFGFLLFAVFLAGRTYGCSNICSEGTYRVQDCVDDPFSSVVCEPCGSCAGGSYMVSECTETQPITCGDCSALRSDVDALLNIAPCNAIMAGTYMSTRDIFCPDQCYSDYEMAYRNYYDKCGDESVLSFPRINVFFCPAQESIWEQATLLLQFKNELANGDCDAELSTWIDNTNPCEVWDGVNCGSNRHNLITEIDLSQRSIALVGTISPALAEIYTLEVVDLSGNDLCGQVPDHFAELPYLSTLLIPNNPKLCGSSDAVFALTGEELSKQSCNLFECPNKDNWLPKQSAEDQRGLLTSFRSALASAPYNAAFAEWQGEDACTWPGITCWESGVNAGLVRSVILGSLFPPLVGAVESLSLITSLETVDLQNNRLCGQIPEFAGSLSCSTTAPLLTSLTLDDNPSLCNDVTFNSHMLSLLADHANLDLQQSCATENLICPSVLHEFPCASGFTGNWDTFVCEACQVCSVGQFLEGCQTTSPGVCTQCEECDSGFYILGCEYESAGQCTICDACDDGFYRLGCQGSAPGSCEVCQTCGTDEYLAGCGGQQPGVCLACDACEPGQYRTECTGRNEGTCISCESCGTNEYRGDCQGTSPGTCIAFEPCLSGEFRDLVSGACQICPSCPTGQYRIGCLGVEDGNCHSCQTCEAGKYSIDCTGTEAGSCTSCESCAAGSYRKNCQAAHEGYCELCDICRQGFYRPNCPGTCESCETCPNGFTRVGCTGSQGGDCMPCQQCAAGSYLIGCSATEVGECHTCEACGAGEYRQHCTGVFEGYCSPCAPGTYSTENDAHCLPCDPGYVSIAPNAGACSPCAAGTYADNPAHTCRQCPSGTYSDGPTNECSICGRGTYQSLAGQDSCDPCPVAYGWVNSTYCRPCLQGEYSSSEYECVPVPAGYISLDAITLIACPIGTYHEYTHSDCRPCGVGFWAAEEASTACDPVPCPVNSHKDVSGHCVPDGGYEGTVSYNPTNGKYTSDLVACATGFWSTGHGCVRVLCPLYSSNHPDCVCDAGYEGTIVWQNGDYIGICSEIGCPAKSTNVADSSSLQPYTCACAEGYHGELTQTSDGFTGTCLQCAYGEFRTVHESACMVTACPPGSLDHPNCVCEAGTLGSLEWRVSAGAYVGSCESCLAGYWSEVEASVCDRIACPSPSYGHPNCICPAGTYGAISWDSSRGEYDGACADCKAGRWSTASASDCDIVVGCPLDTVASITSDGQTCLCDAGFRGSVTWNRVTGTYDGGCFPCNGGSWADVADTDCAMIICPTNSTGHPNCVCSAGFYGSLSWDENEGAYVGSCQACDVGTYSSEDSAQCLDCEIGSWAPAHSELCTPIVCPPNSNMWPECTCKPGFMGNLSWNEQTGVFSNVCEPCPKGYWSEGGNSSCTRVECDERAELHPDCSCKKGYIGELLWDNQQGIYLGSCTKVQCPDKSSEWPDCICQKGTSGVIAWVDADQQYTGGCTTCLTDQYQDEAGQPTCKYCATGFHPDSPVSCARVACPGHSSGHPHCVCNAGTSGALSFDRNQGVYVPESGCQPCSEGYWATQGSSVCEAVSCPAASEGHPTCTCSTGFGGTIQWESHAGAYAGVCRELVCPEFSSGYPDCLCLPGYHGSLFETAPGLWWGECLACEHGFWSSAGDTSCNMIDCPVNAAHAPQCSCLPSFTGDLLFTNGVWSGECQRCEKGYRTAGGSSPCVAASCPPDSIGFPECVCKAGHVGEVEWNFAVGDYSSACVACDPGAWSIDGQTCAQVSCPLNSRSIDHPDCKCNPGFEGSISWDSDHGTFVGTCQPCPIGYGTNQDGVCEVVIGCPDHATVHPSCLCPVNYKSSIAWNRDISLPEGGYYSGECTLCEIGTTSVGGTANECLARPCPSGAINWPHCECDVGYYGSIAWHDDHTYVGSCAGCSPGSYQDTVGSPTCKPTDPGFWAGEAAADQYEVDCIANSHGHPYCQCDAGHSGFVVWSSGAWFGWCFPCPLGHWCVPGGMCQKVHCPPSMTSHPDCHCRAGTYSPSAIVFEDGQYVGECQACADGHWSQAGSTSCQPVACPALSTGAPNCECIAGGSITWDRASGSYVNQCTTCENGELATSDGCEVVPCPEHSDGYPSCRCKIGYTGDVAWQHDAYTGACEPCGIGFTTSEKGSETCSVAVPCPPNSIQLLDGNCACNHQHTGTIVWNQTTFAYEGVCSEVLCPSGATGHPDCECIGGYEEQETLLYDSQRQLWSGECVACAHGSWSQKGSVCTEVPCPSNSEGHPDCICSGTTVGEITWTGSLYQGSCEHCPSGFKPSVDAKECIPLQCPVNSLRTWNQNGTLECTCMDGYHGDIVVSTSISGSCSACPVGFWSVNGSSCIKVPCPGHSIRHPTCECSVGFAGEIIWNHASGQYDGDCSSCPSGFTSELGNPDCSVVPCPAHGVSHPNCECSSPHYYAHETLSWEHSSRSYKGECRLCPDGQYAPDGLRCVDVACPSNSTRVGSACACDAGFSGQIVWSNASFIGSCRICPSGMISHMGEACTFANCPEHATGAPECQCSDGFTGSLEWNPVAHTYSGECLSCDLGSWSTYPGQCVKQSCPPHSVPRNVSGGETCVCTMNHYGVLHWRDGEYHGACQPCGKGYHAGVNSSECSYVSCPHGSTGHPDCVCEEGDFGDIEWVEDATAYSGICSAVPSTTSTSTPHPTFVTTTLPPTPTPTPTRTLASRRTSTTSQIPAITTTATPVPVPTATPCIEHEYHVENADCYHCNGQYFRCGKTEEGYPIFCKDKHSISRNAMIQRVESRWVISESNVPEYQTNGTNTSRSLPPVVGWLPVVSTSLQSAPTVKKACSAVFFKALQSDALPVPASQQEAFAKAIVRVARIARSQVVIDSITPDGTLYFTLDLRLSPAHIMRILQDLTTAMNDDSYINWLSVYNVTATNARLVDASPSASEAEAPVAATPSPVPAPLRALSALVPRGRETSDEHGCLPGSSYCPYTSSCLDDATPCAMSTTSLGSGVPSDAGCETPEDPKALNKMLASGASLDVIVT